MATDSTLTAALEAMVARAAVLNGTAWRGDWAATSTYASRDLVAYGGRTYMSLINSNRNNRPATANRQWQELEATISLGSGGSSVSSTAVPSPNAVPRSGSDSTLALGWLPPSTNENNIYVSPLGDDSYDGLTWLTAKEHGFVGATALRALGGGNLFLASGVDWGGPVADQGMWFRRDHGFEGDATWYQNSGFILLDVPINIIGCGNDVGNQAFANAPLTNFIGGGFSRFKPRAWILGSGAAMPITIQNMQGASGIIGAKTGVDYDRNLNGTIRELAITNATRTGTSTVFTVTLPTAITVLGASRASNVTTLYITNPGYPYQPWRLGQHIQFTSGNVNYSSGDKALTFVSNSGGEGDNVNWTIQYAETAADQAYADIAASYVQSHNCSQGELIDLITSNSHWKPTQYYVSAATATTITVEDIQGDGDANVNNIGTLVHQERYYGHTNMVKYVNCSFAISQAPDPGFISTHGFDFGGNLAVWPKMINCWVCGNNSDYALVNPDPRITSAVFAYAGLHAGASVIMRECYGIGQAYLEAGSDGIDYLEATDCLIEAVGFGVDTRPGIYVRGNAFTRVHIDNFERADGAAGAVSVELYGMPMSNSIVTRSGIVKGVCQGGDSWRTPGIWSDPGVFPTPWQGQNGLQVCSWADGRITGIHPASNRNGGVMSARFKNIVAAPGSWVFDAGGSVVEGYPDPDGGSGAQKITVSGDQYIRIFPAGVDGNTWEVGGKIIVGGYICSPDVGTYEATTFHVLTSDVTFSNDMPNVTADANGAHFSTPYSGQGWNLFQHVAIVETVSDATPSFSVALSLHNGSQPFTYGLFAYYVPLSVTNAAGTVPIRNSDAFEHFGTVKRQPRYLRPGEDGTMEGRKLYGHGGLGGANQVITLEGTYNGKAAPFYDPATGLLLGYLPLFDEA